MLCYSIYCFCFLQGGRSKGSSIRSKLDTPVAGSYLHSAATSWKKGAPQQKPEAGTSLDTIITEFLRKQHALCKNPVVTCPPFSLLKYVELIALWPLLESFFLTVQVNLDMTDPIGPGKLVRHMQNLSDTYDEYLICTELGPSISSVICKNLSYSGLSYPSSLVLEMMIC